MKEHIVNLDISRRSSIRGKMDSIVRIYKKFGFITMLHKIYIQLYFCVNKIDFSPVSIQTLDVIGANQKEGVTYVNASWEILIEIISNLKKINKDILEGSFVDFGSGKGGIIIQAKKLGFTDVIGIEFAKELCLISKSNIKKILKTDAAITIINDDAQNYIPPKKTRLIFLYNPFSKKIMEPVIENIVNVNYSDDVFILYVNPVLDKMFIANSKIVIFDKIVATTGDIVHIYKITK